MKRMDAGERKAAVERLRPYVGALQSVMRLSHWRIDVLDEDAGEHCNADITWWEDKFRANLRFADDCLTASPEEQRYSIVHELLHLHLRGLALVEKSLRRQLSEALWDLLDDRFEHEEELAVDGLASVLAPLMPLPPAADDEPQPVAVAHFVE